MSGRQLRRVAVFCGSNFGEGDRYREAAASLGREFAARGIALVYGGTHKGLMGVVADAVIDAGGNALGVITQRLVERGHLHPRLSAHEILADMRTRKARMRELADACIALPGGIGTVEEFMEAWTLNQLGDTDSPVGLLDVGGFFDPFLKFIDGMIAQRFLPAEHKASLVVRSDAGALIDALAAQPAITVPKWM